MNKTSIRWVKALLKEGIMVARPAQLRGIRERLENDVRQQERKRIADIMSKHLLDGSKGIIAAIIDDIN